MLNKNLRLAPTLIAMACMGVFSACMTFTPVKDITSDQMGYLANRFSPQQLSPNILTKIPPAENPSGFEKIVVIGELVTEKNDGKKEFAKAVSTYIGTGNGLIQKVTELSRNEISYGLLYSLSYKGFISLKWQQVPLRSVNANFLYEMKDAGKFDAIPPSLGKEFEVSFKSAPEHQLANFSSYRRVCNTIRYLAASDIHKKFIGQALEIECELKNDNVVRSRDKWAYLQDYGFAIMLEDITSSEKTTLKIVDING